MMMSVAAAPPARQLVSRLAWTALVRAVAALAVSAYLVGRMPMSAVDVAHAVAAYWIVDGLVLLSASALVASLALSRILVLLRGAIAVGAGLAMFGLRLDAVFGPWRPGYLVVVTTVTTIALSVIGLQILAAAVDVSLCRAARRRVPGDWSVALGAALSVAFGVGAAATFVTPPATVAVALGALAAAAGVGLFASAVSLRCRQRYGVGVSGASSMPRGRNVVTPLLIVAAIVCVVSVLPVAAQDDVIRFEGRVAWIAGASMVVTLTDGPSIDIDLRRIPQSELRMISPSDYVFVTGLILRPGRRVLALSIQPLSAWYPQAP